VLGVSGIFVVLVVLAILSLPAGGGRSSSSSSSSSPDGSRSATTPDVPENKWKDAKGSPSTIGVYAREIVAAYKENEIAADARFKGKTITVTGEVATIGKDILDTPYVTLSAEPVDSFRTVQASFSRDAADELAGLRKGQTISVVCRSNGLLMNVLLDRCAIR
jgi:hypothetical protein